MPVFHALTNADIQFTVFSDGKPAQSILEKAGQSFTAIKKFGELSLNNGLPKIFVSSLSTHGDSIGAVALMKMNGVPTFGYQTMWGSFTAAWMKVAQPDFMFILDNEFAHHDVLTHWSVKADYPESNIFPFGSPDLEVATRLDMQSAKNGVYMALDIQPYTKVVTYFGEKKWSGVVAQQLVNALNTIGFDGLLVMRPHPAMLAGNYPEEQLAWDRALNQRGPFSISAYNSRISTLDLIAASKVVTGISSTTLLQCAAMKPAAENSNISILFPDTGAAWFEQSSGGLFDKPPLVDLGASFAATNAAELEHALRTGLNSGLDLESFPIAGATDKIVAKLLEHLR